MLVTPVVPMEAVEDEKTKKEEGVPKGVTDDEETISQRSTLERAVQQEALRRATKTPG